MKVTCPKCMLVYDDTYRLTFCPHEKFEMNMTAYNGKESKVCHTVEELQEFMRNG